MIKIKSLVTTNQRQRTDTFTVKPLKNTRMKHGDSGVKVGRKKNSSGPAKSSVRVPNGTSLLNFYGQSAHAARLLRNFDRSFQQSRLSSYTCWYGTGGAKNSSSSSASA
jgi:ATP-dependent protease HslVU (ClpYQ) peptidase subunit